MRAGGEEDYKAGDRGEKRGIKSGETFQIKCMKKKGNPLAATPEERETCFPARVREEVRP